MNMDFDGILKDLKVAVNEAKEFKNPNAMTINLIHTEEELEELGNKDKEETAEEKKERIGYPPDDIEKLLKELDHEKSIEKLKEHEIDAALFWELEEGEMAEMLDVTKVYGDKKRFLEKIADIKKKHTEAKEKAHKDSKKVKTDGIRDMLKR